MNFDYEAAKQKWDFVYLHTASNLGVHSRWIYPLLFTTEYTYLSDDDVLPGPRWLENCIRVISEKNAIVSPEGRIVTDIHDGSKEIGIRESTEDKEVDFGIHGWGFRTEWARHFWRYVQLETKNSDDIHMSIACKLADGIRTFVAGAHDKAFMGDAVHYGADQFATYKQPNHEPNRRRTMEYWVQNGWKTLQ